MLLSGFFKTLEKAMPTPAVAKTYCLELYVCIIRCCSVEKIEKYMKGIVSVQAAKSLVILNLSLNRTVLKSQKPMHRNLTKYTVR